MSTSGGTIVNAVLYVLELVLAVQLAAAFTGVTSRASALSSLGRRRATGAAAIWLVVAVPSLLQVPFPALFTSLRRDPDLIRRHGQVWRVFTSLVVQDGGLGGTVFNLVVLALVAVAAVLVWGPVLAAVLFVVAHLIFNVMATFLSTDVGAGNSGATFGLAATLAGFALALFLRQNPRPWPLLGRALGVVLIGVVLIVLGDAHGVPMIGGVLLGVIVAPLALRAQARTIQVMSAEHAVLTSERVVAQINGADLCYQTFGAATDPAILLIGGASSSMDGWWTGFCETLAAAGRFVIRYDFRDTGQSATCPPGEPDYTGLDLEQDALALLDHLRLPAANIAGISMGGMLSQRLAVEHPERVLTLTLLSTSPAGPGNPENGLPPVEPVLSQAFSQAPPEPDPADREAVIDHTLAGYTPYDGSVRPDPAERRAFVELVLDRSRDISAGANHVQIQGGDPVRDRLGEISVPTLVLHGTEDPLFPIGHGEALAREIPGARLIPLEGLGHDIPARPFWPEVTAAIIDLTAGG